MADLRRVNSRALRAALAGAGGLDALADNAPSYGRMLVEPLTELFIDELLDVALMSLLSLPLVCPSNCGWGSRTLTTAIKPSRTSSPVIVTSSFCSLSIPERTQSY